jgi:spore maturation protein CgeB
MGDTPVTLEKLANGEHEYLTPALIPQFDMYLSFTGGPTLTFLEGRYGSPMARALYCSVDSDKYRPVREAIRWDLGYLGTYSKDRQPGLESLMLDAARQWPQGRFSVVGPMYPEDIRWPANVDREIHLSPREHAAFYGAQRFTLNITRVEMKKAGFSPSVRLFEAGACAVPVISDWWEGLDSLFEIGTEVMISEGAEDTLRFLRNTPEAQRLAIGNAARRRVLAEHTPEHRAIQLENYLREIDDNASPDTSRRNGRGGGIHHGFTTGLASQQYRETAGRTTGAEVGAMPNPGNLLEPSGTSDRNGRADRTPASTGVKPAGGSE